MYLVFSIGFACKFKILYKKKKEDKLNSNTILSRIIYLIEIFSRKLQ